MLGIQHSEVGGQRGYRLTGNYARRSLFATTRQGADQAAQLLRSRRQRTRGSRRFDLGQSRSPLGLVLIGLGQLTRLDPLGDIGSELSGIALALAGQARFDPAALPLPVRLAHLGSSTQLRSRGATGGGLGLGLGHGARPRALAGQPQGDGEADIVLAATIVAIELVAFARQLQGHGLGGPAGGGGATGSGRLTTRRRGLRFGLTRPSGIEGLLQR